MAKEIELDSKVENGVVTTEEVITDDGVRVNKITATFRTTLKLKENFFTIELSEENLIPEDYAGDFVKLRKDILNRVYNTVFDKGEEVFEIFGEK